MTQRSGSAFEVRSIAHTGDDIIITFNALTGRTYRLEHKADLSSRTWDVAPNTPDFTASATGPAELTDPGGALLDRAFYRVKPLP